MSEEQKNPQDPQAVSADALEQAAGGSAGDGSIFWKVADKVSPDLLPAVQKTFLKI